MDPFPGPPHGAPDGLRRDRSTSGADDKDLAGARRQWRSVAETLFPALMTDPAGYAGAVEAIGAVAAAFTARSAGLAELAVAFAEPERCLADLGVPMRPGVPPILLVATACAMRERVLIAEDVRRCRSEAVRRAREAGRCWAVLQGPEQVEELTGGGTGGPSACSHLHLPSGTELRATIDAWSTSPFRVDVIPADGGAPSGAAFGRREPWLTEFAQRRCEIEQRAGSGPRRGQE